MEWIERSCAARLVELTKSFPALVVTGPRQTGKTSLLRRLFPDSNYVSLDLPAVATEAELSPESFLSSHPPPVVIDEVQYAPALFRHLKTAIDEDRNAKGQFVLTGSQKFTLMKEVSDSLAGRCALMALPGLTIQEILAAGKRVKPGADGAKPSGPSRIFSRAVGRSHNSETRVSPSLRRHIPRT